MRVDRTLCTLVATCATLLSCASGIRVTDNPSEVLAVPGPLVRLGDDLDVSLGSRRVRLEPPLRRGSRWRATKQAGSEILYEPVGAVFGAVVPLSLQERGRYAAALVVREDRLVAIQLLRVDRRVEVVDPPRIRLVETP